MKFDLLLGAEIKTFLSLSLWLLLNITNWFMLQTNNLSCQKLQQDTRLFEKLQFYIYLKT